MVWLKFPDRFLWGSATAAHQVEGNNTNSDWWAWEQEYAGKPGGPAEASGIACDSYNRYEEDFDIAKKLNHNVHRLSLEWARIEPKEGQFDPKELEHYRKVLKSVKSRGMSTFVTLWHFSLPVWVREKKGWGNLPSADYFSRYAKYVAQNLGEDIDFFVTLNEPQVYLTLRHLLGAWLPQKKSSWLDFIEGWIGLVSAHQASYKAIKSVNSSYKVGMVENIMYIDPKANDLWNRLVCEWRKFLQYRLIFRFVNNYCDFIGINYYFHDVIGPWDVFLNSKTTIERDGEVSDWGWQIFPEGLYYVVKEFAGYKKPIYITENGLADAMDLKRESFIVRHLYWLHKAISEGIDVRGYMHWSLLDNFEWSEGYKRKFGLVEVDRDHNLQRKIRPSAYTYGDICKENGLSEELVRRYIQ